MIFPYMIFYFLVCPSKTHPQHMLWVSYPLRYESSEVSLTTFTPRDNLHVSYKMRLNISIRHKNPTVGFYLDEYGSVYTFMT